MDDGSDAGSRSAVGRAGAGAVGPCSPSLVGSDPVELAQRHMSGVIDIGCGTRRTVFKPRLPVLPRTLTAVSDGLSERRDQQV